ncbi:MAG: S9 family peptidase [Elusimicrobia bacterium]|nr:S9 family peptidase [Elusimicrobiota bacterium]
MIPLVRLALAALPAAALPYGAEELAATREVSSLALSPDGCQVAFAADISGSQELWLAPACGPAKDREPRPLREEPAWPDQASALGGQATELAFSPDGASVLFASDHGGDERRDLFLASAARGSVRRLTRTRSAETDPDADGGAAFSPDGRSIAYVADGETPFLFQLFVMDLETRQARQLTRERASLRRPVWSPDGRTIAVTRSPDGQRGELLLVELQSGATRQVAPLAPGGILLAEEYVAEGTELLCLATNPDGFLQMALVPASGGNARLIGPGDWDVEQAAWRPGLGFVFHRNENGRSALYRLSGPEAVAAVLLGPAGRITGFALDREGRRLAYLWGDAAHPSEAWVMDLATRRTVAVTRSLVGGLDPRRLAAAQHLAVVSSDGLKVPTLYLPPAELRLGDPPPVVVAAHGGPDGQTYDAFDAQLQALSQAGFAVLAPNYRGSSGYGRRFLDLNNKDWGGQDLEDLWAGVARLAELGLADPGRAGLTGGSYGGYLTLMGLARQPERWKAGVEAFGMPDLALDFELSGERFLEWYRTEMGTPAGSPGLFRERSPLSYLDNLRAPLLIFQGANDTNVPPAESELIYRKLLERRVPVGLVVYPDEGHGFTRRANRIDYDRRLVEFFSAKLAPKAPAAAEDAAP